MTVNVDFIAEVSSNHNRDIDRCFKLISAAKAVGATSVKFQLFSVENLFSQEILNRSADHRKRVDWELPLSFVPELSSYARQLGLKFGCTPFYLDAVDELNKHVDFFKISSYEILWLDLIKSVASTNKPVILSTGMATLHEVRSAVQAASACNDLTLLHCVSSYPTPLQDCNLAAIQVLRDEFNIKVGWSDHSGDIAVLLRAIFGWNASHIEFHFDLDGMGSEYEGGHCWLPSSIGPVIEIVNKGFQGDGKNSKEPSLSEISDRDWRADPVDGLRPLRHIRKAWLP